jgi:hypothetical protein
MMYHQCKLNSLEELAYSLLSDSLPTCAPFCGICPLPCPASKAVQAPPQPLCATIMHLCE